MDNQGSNHPAGFKSSNPKEAIVILKNSEYYKYSENVLFLTVGNNEQIHKLLESASQYSVVSIIAADIQILIGGIQRTVECSQQKHSQGKSTFQRKAEIILGKGHLLVNTYLHKSQIVTYIGARQPFYRREPVDV